MSVVEDDPPDAPESSSWIARSARRVANRRIEAARVDWSLASAGTAFALSLIIGALLGVWIDKLTGWSPWCFVTFFILGFAAGVRSVYLAAKGPKR